MPLTIIADPADWKASEWEGREEEYTYRFTSQVLIPQTCRLIRLTCCRLLHVLGLAVTHSRAAS